ncbi:GATA zinc finger domain-containing protein 7-like [Palaemon carinicauda]|uniref:GATA zinc finger domain-containing protein 7-like n=1 Tax=Palaemon carinicauda TaxID=392227 RepID=UPI0035B61E0D
MYRIVGLICGVALMNLRLTAATSEVFDFPDERSLNYESLLFVNFAENASSVRDFTTNESKNESKLGNMNQGVNLLVQTTDTSQPSNPRVDGKSDEDYSKRNESTKGNPSFLAPEYRQFSMQNNHRFNSNNNQMTGSVNAQIIGSNPHSAVQMVQSYVENMINRPGEDRPGYIMINSPNPAVISQLAEALTQHYGSSSVIRESEAIQNFLSNVPDAGTSNLQTQVTTNSPSQYIMPVFPNAPFNSRTSPNATRGQTQPSETDYITQKLSALADISVSSGMLINDTLSHRLTNQFQTPAPPVINFTVGNTGEYLNANDIPSLFPNPINLDHTEDRYTSEENFIIHGKLPLGNSSLNSSKLHSEKDSNNSYSFNKSDSNKNSIDASQTSNYDDTHLTEGPLSNAGFEDYYEEIDGELVLSPTKFMRKTGPFEITDMKDYEYSEHEFLNSNENREVLNYLNDTKQNLVKWTHERDESSDGGKEKETYEDKVTNAYDILNGTDQTSQNFDDDISDQSSNDTAPVLSNMEQTYYSTHEVGNDTISSFIHKGDQTTNSLNSHSNLLDIYSQAIPFTQLHFIRRNNNSDLELMHIQSTESDSTFLDLKTTESPTSISENLSENRVKNYSQNTVPSPSVDSSAKKVLDYLLKMSHKDLEVLGISENMVNVIPYLNESDNALVKDSTYNSNRYRQKNSTLSDPDNLAQVRPNFHPEHFRQSNIRQQQVPSNFFPSRPSTQHNSHNHHEHSHNDQPIPELTNEQQQIISRLPAGMQHIVTSIVQAVQVPLQTTTTPPPSPSPQYPIPFPYPYPYPAYPYFAPVGHPYPPLQPQPATEPLLQHNPLPNHNHPSLSSNNSNHTHDIHHAHNPHGSHPNVHDSHHTHFVNHTAHENHGHLNSQRHEGQHPTPSGHINQPNSDHLTHDSHTIHGNHGSNINRTIERFNNTGSSNHEAPQLAGTRGNQNHHSTSPASSSSPITQNSTVSEMSTSQNITSPYFPLRPAVNPIFSQSRLGEVDESNPNENRDQIGPVFYTSGVMGNGNQIPGNVQRCSQTGTTGGGCHNRLSLGGSPAFPDRNQGLLQLRQDASHMGNGQQANSGILNFRPPAPNSMHMGSPVLNVVLPEIASPLANDEPGPLIDPNPPETTTQQQANEAPDAMDRQEMNSLLQSLFSSPTLLLLGIVFAASAAYMAIAMEEQAAQQRFQQAQLAAAFGGQPFPPGRKRRNIPSADSVPEDRLLLLKKIL